MCACSGGAVAFVAFGVCAVPQFAHVLRVAVDVVQEGFEAVQVFACGVVTFADFFVPVVGDEAGAGPAEADGDGHCLVVADVAREVCLLFVGERVPCVGERGIVGDVEDGGTVGEVSGEGSVQRVKSGGRVDAVVKNAIVGDNEGVIGFVGSPAAPSSAAEGADEPGAWLVTNRSGGVVEQVRGGGRVQKNAGTVEAVSSGGIVERLADGGEVRSLHGRVSFMEGTVSRVESMSGSEGAWAEIGSVSHFATVQRGHRGTPVVGRLGPYSRVHFEDGDAQDVLASIGRVDRGALEAGLIKVTYGFQGESLLPLLREREGLPPAE